MEDIDPLMDSLSPDDLLSPMDKLYKYYQSDDVGERLVHYLTQCGLSYSGHLHTYVSLLILGGFFVRSKVIDNNGLIIIVIE